MKIAAYLIEKIGSTVSGYFHPSLWLSESHELLVAKGLDRIEARGAQGGIKSCGKTGENCKTDSKKDEPPGDGRNVDAGKILAMQVEIGAESERAADEPAEKRSKHAAEKAQDRKSTRLNSSHGYISYAVFCLKKKNTTFFISPLAN